MFQVQLYNQRGALVGDFWAKDRPPEVLETAELPEISAQIDVELKECAVPATAKRRYRYCGHQVFDAEPEPLEVFSYREIGGAR